MDREALGTYKGEHMGDGQGNIGDIQGVFEHIGLLGASGWCPMLGGIQTYAGCPDAPNIWGCQVNAPKCKSYMPLKKIRGV